jgi:hypothetical protein
MHKALIGIAAAATLGLATVAAPSTADARCFGCAVGAGVAAGLIGGALIGGAIANNPPPPPPAYYPPPPPRGPAAYVPPPPEYAQLARGCSCRRAHKVWVEGYGWQWRRHPICP